MYYLQIFEQVLFGIRICAKYLISSSHVDIKLVFYLG